MEKRILITNLAIADYAGSEINCLSLANELQEKGYYVEVATLNTGDPIIGEFFKNNILVKDVLHEELNYKEYDLIWAHHYLILDYLIFCKNITAKKVVFSSLSPFEGLEAPPAYVNKLSLCLANSEETKLKLIEEGVSQEKIEVFPNYAPKEFVKAMRKQYEEKLEKICIISNHIPEELREAIDLLEKENIIVDVYGRGYTTKLIEPETLKPYDAIISIGKSVQYAMAMKIPVYCYDVHGGPGWITRENCGKSFSYNFSGRGFEKKESLQIVNEIKKGYLEALQSLEYLRKYIVDYCLLSKNVDKVLNEIEMKEELELGKIVNTYPYIKRHNFAFIKEHDYNLYRRHRIETLEIETKRLEEMLTENKRITAQKEQIIQDKEQMIQDKEQAIQNKEQIIRDKEQIIQDNHSELEKRQSKINQYEKVINELMERYENTIKEQREYIASIENELKEKQSIIQENMIQLEQKENNCRYLLELNEEKQNELNRIYNTKGWRLLEYYRRNTRRIKKVIKHPSLIIKKLFKGDKNQQIIIPELVNKNEDIGHTEPNTPYVSVVIPIYDRTDVLIESINSILKQSYQNFELILVCDGSPQPTLDIVRQFESNPKVRAFYYQDNSGNAVRGRNKAIIEARGKYLAFQDSDDIADVDRLKVSIEYMEKYGVDVVYGGWKALVDGSRQIDIKNGEEIYSPDCDYEMLKKICVPCQSTVMVKVDALRSVGGLKTSMRYREDHELWLRLAYAGYKFKSIDKILTNLRLHANNLELSFKDEDNKWYELMMKEHKKIIKMKPKIAYVIPGCGISGGIAVICQHLNRLQKRGYDVLMITEDNNNQIAWFPNQKVNIIPVSETPDNIDILVATGWSTAYTVQQLPAKRKCYFVQSDESRFYPEGTQEYFRAMDTYLMDFEFITEAKWIKKWLKEKFNKDATYVPNGLDEKIIYETEPMVKKGEKLRILLEGPIDIPYKGMEDAFNAVNGLDCEVWCISSAGKPKPEWKCDKFFEKVPMEQMKYIYSSCDIFLKMSRVEGFFGPPLEMMACSGACVVGKVTGYDEYIEDGYNALVVEQGDVEGAHRALERLLSDSKLRENIISNGHRTAEEWKWEPSIDTLEKLFFGSVTHKRIYNDVNVCDCCGGKKLKLIKQLPTIEWEPVKRFYKDKNEDNEFMSISDTFSLVQCEECGLVFTNPRLSEDVVNKFYDEYLSNKYDGYIHTYDERYRESVFKDYLNELKSNIKLDTDTINALDIGCASGAMLKVMGGNGFTPYGIEVSSIAGKKAQEYGEVYIGDVIEGLDSMSDASYGIVTLIDSIEHFKSPYMVMKKVYEKLVVGGHVLIETPNAEAEKDEMSRHFYLFSKETITQLLKSIGFRDVRVEFNDIGYNPIDQIESKRFLKVIAAK